MQQYKIHPIALCEGPRDSSHFAYRSESGGICNTACYTWYIEGSDAKILVDAGADAADFTARGAPETDIISVKDGLHKLGLAPEDIDIIIVTHLHCDHIALGRLYKKAKFVVQKTELEYAQDPHPIDAVLYDRASFDGLNWEVIDGDKEITSGISVITAPGHSPGGQSVAINTSAGKAIITGFCATQNTFIPTGEMKRRGWEVTIPLIHHDALQTYDSVIKIKRLADIILPLHDPAFIKKKVIPQ
jgi:glyoxylase-like metal-dependent hydrolase (beta-lactamase superfamily II)